LHVLKLPCKNAVTYGIVGSMTVAHAFVREIGASVGAAVVGSVSTDGLTPLLRWLVRTRARARRFLARPSLVFPIPVPARS